MLFAVLIAAHLFYACVYTSKLYWYSLQWDRRGREEYFIHDCWGEKILGSKFMNSNAQGIGAFLESAQWAIQPDNAII